MRVVIVALGAFLAALLAVPDGRAALHQPEDMQDDLPVSAEGVPQTLPFLEFKRRLAGVRNAGVPKPGLSERAAVENRIKKARAKKADQRTQLESVALAVDLLRFGQPLEADGALVGMHRRGYLGNVTLAHIMAAQGDWRRAFEYLNDANDSRVTQSPGELGLSPQKLAWQVKLNNGPLLTLIRSRWAEAEGPKRTPEEQKRLQEDEKPDPIFPVNFVNEAGVYEPGVLAPGERAKLPADALATVQQLLLWFPHDTRLYWLLGELYAANGEFTAAKEIMDECTWSLSYSNRKLLMQHREAVVKAEKEKGTTTPDDEPLLTPDKPVEQPHVAFTMGAVWVYIGVVGAIAALAFARAMWKRRKSNARAGSVSDGQR